MNKIKLKTQIIPFSRREGYVDKGDVRVKIKGLLVYLCILRVMGIILIMHMNIFLTARMSLQPVS